MNLLSIYYILLLKNSNYRFVSEKGYRFDDSDDKIDDIIDNNEFKLKLYGVNIPLESINVQIPP